ncbi:hypothetical protein HDE_08491 [Halotydeus destructor]|nr:hypothetical protein HDE_08491 [Halotydeus destructor]
MAAHVLANSSTTRPRAAKVGTTTQAYPFDQHVGQVMVKTSKPFKATHAPYPYDQYAQRATHAPYPARSTYAPYKYGEGPEAVPAKKSLLGKDVLTTFKRDFVTYLAAPFMMPAAISNAFNTPPGLPEQSSLWGKIARSFRAIMLRRSEDRDGSTTIPSDENVLLKMKNRLKSSPVWKQFKEKEKRDRHLTTRLIEFFKLRNAKKQDKGEVKSDAGDE